MLEHARLQKIAWRQQPYLSLAGLFMFCLNYILIYPGTGLIASGLVALLFSTSTIFNAVNSAVFYRESVSGRVIAGALLGIPFLALQGRRIIGRWPETGALHLLAVHFRWLRWTSHTPRIGPNNLVNWVRGH